MLRPALRAAGTVTGVSPAQTRQSQVIAIVTATLGVVSWILEADWLLGLAIVGIGVGALWYGLAVAGTAQEPGGESSTPRARTARIAWALLGGGLVMFGILTSVIDLA